MYVRREIAVQELEDVQEWLRTWSAKLQKVPASPRVDGLGNVVSEDQVYPGGLPDDILVSDFLGEKLSMAFSAELIAIAHRLEGLAST